eukprot:8408927-Pyramimonas_sp.AAC.1
MPLSSFHLTDAPLPYLPLYSNHHPSLSSDIVRKASQGTSRHASANAPLPDCPKMWVTTSTR